MTKYMLMQYKIWFIRDNELWLEIIGVSLNEGVLKQCFEGGKAD